MSGTERVIGLLGNRAVERSTLALTAGRLRVLAYHDVADVRAFRRHLEHLTERYNAVSGSQVARALASGHQLPQRAVWITFDDGHPAVFRAGREALNELGLTATAYVNPGLIDRDEPFWWEVVRAAVRHDLPVVVDGETVAPATAEVALKRCHDTVRRRAVSELRERLGQVFDHPMSCQQATAEDLRRWVSDGHEIGNHTWDHPCLDRCEPDVQRRQITQAHDWLTSHVVTCISSFAYPNGNWAQASEDELRRLGYRTALGFDHRLCRRRSTPLRLSRLRIDADAPAVRFRAVLSGLHPTLLALRTSVQPGPKDVSRRVPR